ncbi:MAG: hypothetical protein ACTHJJ_18500, partial [Intrasporangium sp.]|uniref:hypothetical protein n=1 Tax=Intrasporangium sp. TaxID=1925024 RepID=UPI003F80C14D
MPEPPVWGAPLPSPLTTSGVSSEWSGATTSGSSVVGVVVGVLGVTGGVVLVVVVVTGGVVLVEVVVTGGVVLVVVVVTGGVVTVVVVVTGGVVVVTSGSVVVTS